MRTGRGPAVPELGERFDGAALLTQRFSSLSAARSGSTPRPSPIAPRDWAAACRTSIEVGKGGWPRVDRFRAVVLSARAPACLTLLSAAVDGGLHSGKSCSVRRFERPLTAARRDSTRGTRRS